MPSCFYFFPFCFLAAASRMPSSHVSPQMCRPHFPAPLPWLSEPPKSLASSGAWGSPFACPQDPQEKVSQAAAALQSSQSSGQHLFSFPPTPPKDSTPDSVQTGPLEYQAAVNAFMHQAQVTSNSALTGDTGSCGLDIKPCLTNGNNGGQTGASAPKQREGTQHQQHQTTNHSSNNNNNTNSQNNNNTTSNNSSNSNNNNNNSASLNSSSLFDAHQSAYASAYDSYGNYHQTSSAFQTNARSNMSPHNTKPQRTKARTSAGKIYWTRCGCSIYYFFYYFY